MIFERTPDTYYGKKRHAIIDNAKPEDRTVVSKKFFGDLIIIGENHKEAADYLKSELNNCQTKGDEIRLHSETEQKFDVAIQIDC